MIPGRWNVSVVALVDPVALIDPVYPVDPARAPSG
jgi:hypothetical protein